MKLNSITSLLTISALVPTSPAQAQTFYHASDFVRPAGLTAVYDGIIPLRYKTVGYISEEDSRVVNGQFGDSKGHEICLGSIVVKFSYKVLLT